MMLKVPGQLLPVTNRQAIQGLHDMFRCMSLLKETLAWNLEKNILKFWLIFNHFFFKTLRVIHSTSPNLSYVITLRTPMWKGVEWFWALLSEVDTQNAMQQIIKSLSAQFFGAPKVGSMRKSIAPKNVDYRMYQISAGISPHSDSPTLFIKPVVYWKIWNRCFHTGPSYLSLASLVKNMKALVTTPPPDSCHQPLKIYSSSFALEFGLGKKSPMRKRETLWQCVLKIAFHWPITAFGNWSIFGCGLHIWPTQVQYSILMSTGIW